MADEKKETVTKEITEMTMDDLKGIVGAAVKDATAAEIAELKQQIETVNRKAIFPATDGEFGDGEAETIGKSIIDTNFFTKSFSGGGFANAKQDGTIMGRQLVNLGGPFKKLSPEMETFAKMLKTRFNANDMATQGIDVRNYNDTVKAQLKAATGLSEGVAGDGGNLVPVEYLATIIEFATAQSPILSKVWRLPMSSMTMKIPKLTQAAGSYFGGISLHWKDEAAAYAATKPAFEQLSFTAEKLTGLVYLTDELIADSMINIINYITGLFVKAFQYEMERVIVNGSGSNQPLGIINDPNINLVTRTTASTIKFEDIVNLDTAIDENFSNLTWLTRKTALGVLRKLKDTSGNFVFHTDYATFMGQKTVPQTVLGYPLYLTRNMPLYNQVPSGFGPMRTRMNLAVLEHFMPEWTAMDLRGDVPKIAVPTLVLCGELDPMTPPQFSQEIIELLPPGLGQLQVLFD